MIKVAFVLDHNLMEYRFALFNGLVDKGYAITVFHTQEVSNNFAFEQFNINSKRILNLEYRNIPKLNDFDIVIAMQNLRIINIWFQSLNPFRKYKLVHWGIGVSSAGGLSTKKSFISFLRNFISSFSDAIIFYSEFPKKLCSKNNLRKVFVAHNTIENKLELNLANNKKDSFLFIGSLNKRKGLEALIDSFYEYLRSCYPENISNLIIIGDGELKNDLIKKVKELDIVENVLFTGRLNQQSEKIKYFKRAAVSISPFQAGLSVLECFSFGLPFITYDTAISGGEHLNIINGENGYLLSSQKELINKMKLLDTNPDLTKQLGQNAFRYYHSNRTMQDMVNVFVEAFQFALDKKS